MNDDLVVMGLTQDQLPKALTVCEEYGDVLLAMLRHISDRDTIALRDPTLTIEGVRQLQGSVQACQELAGIIDGGLADWYAEGQRSEA